MMIRILTAYYDFLYMAAHSGIRWMSFSRANRSPVNIDSNSRFVASGGAFPLWFIVSFVGGEHVRALVTQDALATVFLFMSFAYSTSFIYKHSGYKLRIRQKRRPPGIVGFVVVFGLWPLNIGVVFWGAKLHRLLFS